jgi:uncharacterized protein YodC (DUF2158 family)
MDAGSVVYLKSGSPQMTIKGIDGDSATCEWFDKYGHKQQEDFTMQSITNVPTDQHFLPTLPLKYGTLPAMTENDMETLYKIMEGETDQDTQQLRLFAKAFFHAVNRASNAQSDTDILKRRLDPE